MAVPEQTPYIEHIGNGVTTSFALEFQCESKDHLIVLVDEIEPPIATWSLTGGNVVFTTAPASGSKITLQRNTPFSRTTDYQSYNNSFRPPAVNKDFDWIWLKLQELGVADWILSNRIDALKNYVDDRDDELRAYLMEEIRRQGVALDQLDDYYNYLMQRLAQIAVDKGWDASFVVDGDKTQKQINDSIASLYNPLNLNYTQQQLATAFTTSLNALIQKVSLTGGGTISIPDGQFQVDLATGIILKDNIELRLGLDTHLIAAPHNFSNYELIEIHDVSNVKLTGGKVDGNKSQNSATTGEWGMGVSIRGATNVHVDTEVVDCWGDGIYIGRSNAKAYSENVHIPKLRTSGNRRQGVSVVSAKGLTGDVWNISEIAGTNPQDGVDFEPNNPDEFLLGVSINTIIAKNVTGSGVEFNLSKFKESELGVNRVDVSIGNIVVDGAGAQGFVCYASTSSNAKGLIKVGKITTIGVVQQDFVVNNWNADSIKVHVTDLFLTPTANKTSVSLVRKTTGFDTGGAVGGCSIDNIYINYPESIQAPTVQPVNVHIATAQLDDVKNVTLGKVYINRSVSPMLVSFNTLDNVSIPKLSKTYSTNIELASATTDGRYIANYYEYISQHTASTPNPFFTVAEIHKGHAFKITGGSSGGARLRFNSNITVEGFNNNGENKTYVIPFGASVEFEAIDTNTVRILSESPNVVNPFTTGSFTLGSDITIQADGSTLISVPFYNKMAGKSYVSGMSASIIGLISQVYSTTSLNAITVRVYNLTSNDITLPIGTVVSVAMV